MGRGSVSVVIAGEGTADRILVARHFLHSLITDLACLEDHAATEDWIDRVDAFRYVRIR